ncbi:terpenoid synthase [Gautieria morchelliformis]|nr:terpenoid synthase [Gautieria morchelliformis]
MSSVKVGKAAPFPPLPGQQYPPARNHPRWKGAPAADFDRMVWGTRFIGVYFLAGDYLDNGKMQNRIPGFKKAVRAPALHPEDRAELCHDIAFRTIKATCHPRTLNQITRCAHEWWDSHIHDPFLNLDQYLAIRRINVGMVPYLKYTLDINLTDEQVNHPLMREAEGIIADQVCLTNDFFSYVKEIMTNSDEKNILRLLQDSEGLTYEEAKLVVEKKIRQKEDAFIPAGMAVLNDPELGKDPEVRRWIACLPYCIGGNNAWSQEVSCKKCDPRIAALTGPSSEECKV